MQRENLEKDVEKHTLRINSLGMDRDYNRYWFFSREGRIFVEDRESTKWGYYSEKEEVPFNYNLLFIIFILLIFSSHVLLLCFISLKHYASL